MMTMMMNDDDDDDDDELIKLMFTRCYSYISSQSELMIRSGEQVSL